MPIFFQQQINDTTRLGIWKIEEPEGFFQGNVPQHRAVTHPHKRLQHLAGRFLLQFLFPGFPFELIQIADTRKPFLPGDPYHFSISHCGDYAAAIVSSSNRVGIDIEIPVDKIRKIMYKFLSPAEMDIFNTQETLNDLSLITTLWSCKEAVFKWYGDGGVDFKKDIRLSGYPGNVPPLYCQFKDNAEPLLINHHVFDQLVLAWTFS